MQLNTRQFNRGVIISSLLAVVLFACSAVFGKAAFFLMLNNDMGIAADYFFGAYTNGGDGSVWIVTLLVTVFVLKKPKAWPLLVSACAISTLLTQVPKNFIIPGTPRPWTAIADHNLIHHVSFVPVLLFGSFPSGHTMTAFCNYLIFCLLLKKNWWLYVGLAYAMLVGYSRIYLAQHFPLDVAGGITGAIITMWLSLLIQKAVYKQGPVKRFNTGQNG